MEYKISAITSPFGEPVDYGKTEHDPERAILRWLEYSKKYPTCASIQPQNKEDGLALLKWAKLNFDKLEAYFLKYKCPYKTDWMRDQIDSQVNNNKVDMQWEWDELFPFSIG